MWYALGWLSNSESAPPTFPPLFALSRDMSGNVSLTPKQERLIALLLQGSTIVDAAKATGISEQTAHRWLKDAAFQHAYEAERKRLLNHSLTKLQLKFDKAVQTLDRHLESAKTIPRDQVHAAEIVIDKTIQTAQLVERIAELEAKLAELEAKLAEQEQDQMYKVTFDLRLLKPDERAELEELNDRVAARQQTRV